MDYFSEAILQFKNRLDEIEKNIEFISLQKDMYNIIKNDSNMSDYANKLGNIINSTVQYNSIIICLYGCFEEYIDEISLKYIKTIDGLCDSYSELPKSIRDKHLYKVGEFLSNPQRYKGYELTVEDCIKNLYMSINSYEDRKLNEELLISHSGNMKLCKIYDLFRDLGIKNTKSKIEDIECRENYNLLDELIDQRNIISHSWKVEQRLSYEKIKDETIVLLKEVGEKLKDILLDEIFSFMHKKDMLVSFDAPIQVINNRILCINCKNSYLEMGDSIIFENDNCLGHLKILNIEINNTNVKKVEVVDKNIGIEVNKNIKDYWRFYYVRK